MRTKKTLALALSCVFIFTACALNLPIIEPDRPLMERVIGGAGPDKILIIDISGVITIEEKSELGGIRRTPSILSRVKEELDIAWRDPHIRAIILKINSPGGAVTASDILHHELLDFKARKSVKMVACLMEMGTSGAYYIATAADKIVAHPSTINGSIGVMMMKVNASGLMQKVGVLDETVTSGDKKDILTPFRSFTDDEKKVVQNMVNELQQQFLQVIRNSRPKITPESYEKFSDGRILSSSEALDLGLIDRVGYINDAVLMARDLAGLPTAQVIMYQPPYAYRQANIYSQAEGKLMSSDPLSQYLNSLFPVLSASFMYIWMP